MSDSAFTLWSVLRRDPLHPVTEQDGGELEQLVADLAEGGTTVRGFYDVSGLRADADLMIWLHGATAEGLQRDLRRLRRTELLQPLLPVWNAMGVHRDAEFNRAHVPGFLRGIPAKEWLCRLPVRAQLRVVPPARRGASGRCSPTTAARAPRSPASSRTPSHPSPSATTNGCCRMEADELTDLVDMMRDLRYTEARRHVREEVPFFTGRLVTPAEIVEVLA